MANQDTPNGLTCIKMTREPQWYGSDASKANPIGIGDPVTQEADGNVILATAGVEILGVAIGFRTSALGYVKNSDGKILNYLPAATAGEVLVIDDIEAEFVIQTDGYTTGTTPVSKAAEGTNMDGTSTTCDTTTGRSRIELDADGNSYSGAETNSRQFRILRLYKEPNNNYVATSDGQWTKLVVRINEHMQRDTTGI